MIMLQKLLDLNNNKIKIFHKKKLKKLILYNNKKIQQRIKKLLSFKIILD